MTAPCRYCPDRQVGCHAKCPAYQAFRADKDRENQINLMMQRPKSRMADIIVKRKTKDIKRGRKI